MSDNKTPSTSSYIIRFALTFIAVMAISICIGAFIDNDYVATMVAIVINFIVSMIILAPLDSHSLPKKKEQD